MSTLEKLIYLLIAFAFVLYLFNPLLTISILVGVFAMVWVRLKMCGADIFISPTKPSETPIIWITRSRKIFLLRAFDKMEGYLALPGWGTIRVAPDSDYSFGGGKAMVGVEGINHTVRLEHVKLTEKLAEKGLKNLKDARKAYGIKTGEEELAERT